MRVSPSPGAALPSLTLMTLCGSHSHLTLHSSQLTPLLPLLRRDCVEEVSELLPSRLEQLYMCGPHCDPHISWRLQVVLSPAWLRLSIFNSPPCLLHLYSRCTVTHLYNSWLMVVHTTQDMCWHRNPDLRRKLHCPLSPGCRQGILSWCSHQLEFCYCSWNRFHVMFAGVLAATSEPRNIFLKFCRLILFLTLLNKQILKWKISRWWICIV